MKRTKIYLSCMGEVYELSKTKYRAFLKEVARTGSADLNNFGKFLGTISNVTDFSQTDAGLILSGGRKSSLPTI